MTDANRVTLGIDIGTTGIKAVLLDPERGIIARVARPSTLRSERPGWAEADPREWYDGVIDSIREILATTGIAPEAVGAIATTGMVPAVIVLDSAGDPLRPAILQNDGRAVEEIGAMAAELGDLDVLTLTGSAISQQWVGPTARWLARHEPEVWAAATTVLGSYDWILTALGAPPHVELNWAIESGLAALDGEPVDVLLDAAGVPSRLIPPTRASGDIAGELSARVAEATGLVAGTPLVVGGADHVLSAYAAGVESAGDWLIKLGGAGDVLVAADRPVTDSRLYLDAHPVPGRWLPNGCMATSGSLIRWLQSITGAVDPAQLDAEALQRRPADLLCLPYFLGEKSPLHDPELRGAFAGLHLGHTRADLHRAVLEGIAFGFRHHVEVFAEIGIPMSRVMVTNGGSRSTLWKQIHAEVLDTELLPVVDHPGASLGAAIIAAIGVSALPGWTSSERFLALGDPVRPDPAHVEIYRDAYERWRDLGQAVAPISHALVRRSGR